MFWVYFNGICFAYSFKNVSGALSFVTGLQEAEGINTIELSQVVDETTGDDIVLHSWRRAAEGGADWIHTQHKIYKRKG